MKSRCLTFFLALFPFLLCSSPVLADEIESVITSGVEVKEQDAQRAVRDILEKFVLNPENTSIVYSEGCSENSAAENCAFYRNVAKLGGCGNGEGLSSENQESCLKNGLAKLYFFRDHDYLSFDQVGDTLKYRIKLFYFLDGNHTVANSNGKDIHQVTLKQSANNLSITDFPIEAMPSYHLEKAKYFHNTGNLESAIEECSIAYIMDRNNESHLSRLRQYMVEYAAKKNSGYDPEFALENINAGHSPFYAQGDVQERNYLRPEFHKENVSEPTPGTLVWKGSFKQEEVSLRDEALLEGNKKRKEMPLGVGGVEIMTFKFGEKEKLPDKKPREAGQQQGE